MKLTELPNGVRLAIDEMVDIGSVSMAIAIGVGGRHETEEICGISHFSEHMVFKGSRTMNVKQIAEFFDGMGAQYNAYTGKENTVFYFKVLSEHWQKAALALIDMVFFPTLPHDEFEREKGVIIEEINESNDDPEDRTSEMYMNHSYSGQQMGRPILGYRDNINSMSRDTMATFMKSHYGGRNVVVSVSGSIKSSDVETLLSPALSQIPAISQRAGFVPAHYVGGDVRESRALEQIQIYFGFPGVSSLNESYYLYKVAAIILGGGMSSRLFQEAREKRGLAYSIHSYSASYLDCGSLTIYASASPSKASDLIRVSVGQMIDMTNNVSVDELEKAKNRIKASSIMSREDTMSRALWAANSYLVHDRYITIDEIRERVERTTIENVQSLLRDILQKKQGTLALLGNLENVIGYDEFLNILQ